MSYEQRSYAGNATDTTLAADMSAGVLTFSVKAGDGANFPDGSGGPFYLIVDYDTSAAEKVRVTGRTSDTFTCPGSNGRGVDGTVATTHSSGAKVRHCWTATDAQEANRAALNTVGRVTTKGDLLAGTTGNALDRVAAGSNGQVLTADSTQTTGVKWAVAPSDASKVPLATVTTKGDLLTATGNAAVGRTGVGVDNTVLTADSAQTGGVSYKTLATLLALLATSKGDLLVNNGTTVVRVPVGTNGQRLVADSTQTAGVKWATTTIRVPHTFAVTGTLAVASGATGYIPPFYIPVPTGQTATVAAVRCKVRAGTVTANVTKNGTSITGLAAVAVTTTAATTSASGGNTCADGDEIAVVLSSPSTADGLSLTIYVDYTV